MLEICHKYYFSANIYSQIWFYEKEYILVLKIVYPHGFYMVIITRSKSSGLNMSIAAEVREYFDNLIKPLVTKKSWTRTWVQSSLARKHV